MTEPSTEHREVIRHPRDGTAGLAVRRDDNHGPHETKYTVEQLWGDRTAEPVYVGDEDDVLRLIAALCEVMNCG